MARSNRRKQSEIAVIGLGRFGSRLARRLTLLGHSVLGIDIDPAKVQDIADEISEALILDVANEEALLEIDLGSFNTVVVTMIDDFEACTLGTLSAKRMGVNNVIAVTHSDRHREILERLGADRVIRPIQESGDRLADDLAATGIMQSMVLTPERELAELQVPRGLVGKLVASCVSLNVLVLAVLRDGKVMPNPPGHLVFKKDDILVVLGEAGYVDDFAMLQ